MKELSTQNILDLRYATRDLAQHLTERLTGYLCALESNFKRTGILGQYIRSSQSVKAPGAKHCDTEFKCFSQMYADITQDQPYGFKRQLDTPLELYSAVPTLYEWQYNKSISNGRGQSKTITVKAPGKWILAFEGYDPKLFLGQIVNQQSIKGKELHDYIVHYMYMSEVVKRQPKMIQLLKDLRFHIKQITIEPYGRVPFIVIESEIRTFLPSEEIVSEITQLSGCDYFDELVDISSLDSLSDTFRTDIGGLLEKNGIAENQKAIA